MTTLEDRDRAKLHELYGERSGKMTVEEYARADAEYAARFIQPGTGRPERTEWTHYLMQLHVYPDGTGGNRNDFELSVDNQHLYKREFLAEYTRRYNQYFGTPD